MFGRAFRTNVQPVELARKLVKEMDDNRTVSVSRVYVPNEYTVYLSPADRSQFEAYEESLKLELQEYLAEHARREGYVMLSPPTVLITTDADLSVGEFGIATRMVQRSRAQGRRSQPPAPPPVVAGAGGDDGLQAATGGIRGRRPEVAAAARRARGRLGDRRRAALRDRQAHRSCSAARRTAT